VDYAELFDIASKIDTEIGQKDALLRELDIGNKPEEFENIKAWCIRRLEQIVRALYDIEQTKGKDLNFDL